MNECPVCGHSVPVTGLERHVNSHLDEAESARDHALALELAAVSCTISPQIQAAELKNCVCDERDCQWGNEEAPWKRIKMTDCTSTSRKTSSNGIGKDVQFLILTQRIGKCIHVEEGILKLIKDCLCSEIQDLSCTIISAHVDHFETCRSEDAGWGCGWRNIQMLSSNLLTYQWAREALFGGAGFVPDIPSLQKWLELAWACGFDEQGAESFDFQIHGSKEWIGAAECATLLRSFGLRARIVDFSSVENLRNESQATIDRWFPLVTRPENAGRRMVDELPANTDVHDNVFSSVENLRNKSQVTTDRCVSQVTKPEYAHGKMFDELPLSTDVHYNVECDGCGVYPIQGSRYKSKTRANYDLCSLCMAGIAQQDNYERIASTNVKYAKQEVAKDEDVNHEFLVKWVWNYFFVGIKDAASKTCLNLFQGHVAESGCSPLYFQHQGHSRTIIGVQRRKKSASSKEEVFLLVLDPSTKTLELLHALRTRKNWQKMIKRGVHTLKKRSYQLCYVEPGVVKGEELEQLKKLRSEQIPTN